MATEDTAGQYNLVYTVPIISHVSGPPLPVLVIIGRYGGLPFRVISRVDALATFVDVGSPSYGGLSRMVGLILGSRMQTIKQKVIRSDLLYFASQVLLRKFINSKNGEK